MGFQPLELKPPVSTFWHDNRVAPLPPYLERVRQRLEIAGRDRAVIQLKLGVGSLPGPGLGFEDAAKQFAEPEAVYALR